MHYGFKMKYNKIDSNQNRNFLIPEIDFLLNEALALYVNIIAFPRNIASQGFELGQRTIDNIRPLVVSGEVPVQGDIAPLPENYWHFVSGTASCTKDSCTRNDIRLFPQQTEDLFQESKIYNSDFLWGTLNCTFTSEGLKVYPKDFSVEKLKLNYIKLHPYMHNARDWEGGQYKNFKEEILTNHQNCELPDDSCKDIVDIAVFLASNSIQDSGYNAIKEKLTFNQTN